jgi:hypothetical protein
VSNRRTALELLCLALIAVAGIVLGLQQGRTSEGLDDMNKTIIGTQVIRCLELRDKLDDRSQIICDRANRIADGQAGR